MLRRPTCSTDGPTLAGRIRPRRSAARSPAATSIAARRSGLRGWYLFSDYCTGTLFGIPSDAEGVIGPRTCSTRRQREHVRRGTDGELYLADLDGGTIYRIVAGD